MNYTEFKFTTTLNDGKVVNWSIREGYDFDADAIAAMMAAMRAGLQDRGWEVGPLVKITEQEEIIS